VLVEACRHEREQEKAWDDYVQRAGEGGHSHLSAWRHVIERSYGHRAFYLQAVENGTIKGILPLFLLRSALFGKSLVSLPFLDDGGICADDHATAVELYGEAVRMSERYRVDSLDLRHRQPSGLDLPRRGSKVTFALELAATPELVWRRLDSKVRNQIRKALNAGLTVSWHGPEGLDSFYDIFAANMRDLGSPVHGRNFFAAILDVLSDTAKLILVHHEGQAIGGGLCLSFKDTVTMPWASSRREHFSKCPNNLLYWEVIQRSCKDGFRRFDFGRSSRGSGTYHFKKQWGATEQPLAWEIGGKASRRGAPLQSTDRAYALGARIWKSLPVSITRLCGPWLRQHISN